MPDYSAGSKTITINSPNDDGGDYNFSVSGNDLTKSTANGASINSGDSTTNSSANGSVGGGKTVMNLAAPSTTGDRVAT